MLRTETGLAIESRFVWLQGLGMSLLFSHWIVSNSLWHGLKPARLLCPWNFPCKHTGVGCHFLFQGIFLIQGSNPCLLHWQVGSLLLSHKGGPLLVWCWVMYLLKLYPWTLSYLSWKGNGKRWNINRTLFQGMRRKSWVVLLPMILDVVRAQGRLPSSKSQGHIDYFELKLLKKQPMQEKHSEPPFHLLESRK